MEELLWFVVLPYYAWNFADWAETEYPLAVQIAGAVCSIWLLAVALGWTGNWRQRS